MKLYEALAEAFAAEDVRAIFALMGDANMHWSIAMSERGAQVIHARHENAAVAMAEGYAQASGGVGVASVTSGPGITPIATSLTAAARGRVPIVVFAGDIPQGGGYHLQQFDIAPYVASTGARLVTISDVDNAAAAVQRAFVTARTERLPVVLTAPSNLQDAEYPWEWVYQPSTQLLAPPQRPDPDPDLVARAADLIAAAGRVVVVAGKGAVAAGARDAVLQLADRSGAILATSLKGKGLFDGEAFDAGIAGAFSSTTARGYFAEADLVIGIGAGLGHFTTEDGYLFPSAQVVKVDLEPRPLHEGVPGGDLLIRADARATVAAIVAELDAREHRPTGWRTEETRFALASATTSEPEVEIAPGTVDPRDALRAVDAAVPKDWLVVVGAGHMWNFAVEHLTGRTPDRFIFTIDFGPVGQAIGVAIGAAVARPDVGVALVDGDGGLLMHVQELETLHRHDIPVTIFVVNDGAFGAEVHKLVARGLDPKEAIFGAPDLAAVAQAFGVDATHVGAETPDLASTFAGGTKVGAAHLFDIHVSPNVPSAQFRRLHFGETT